MKNLISAPWHPMRIVRIIFGIYSFFQFYQTQEMMFAVVGLILVGACMGYGYYWFIGCRSGTYLITSKPLNSTLYFAILGYFFVGLFKNLAKSNSI